MLHILELIGLTILFGLFLLGILINIAIHELAKGQLKDGRR